ncbi:hypothetical protein EGW08_019151, partial [Elysia chlorotica]
MWEEGVNASKPVKLFAEEGDPKYLDSESKQGYGGVLDTFTAPPVNSGVGSTSVMVALDGKHTQLSFMMKIIPSPDWFVGLSSEDLCESGKWRKHFYAELRPMDAGTDQGFTFTAPNWPHEPHQPISEITNVEPNHPASSFYYPEYEPQQTLKQRDSCTHCSKFFNISELLFLISTFLPLVSAVTHCEVTEWTEWTPCSQTCGFGKRKRSRDALSLPSKGGANCPPLRQESLCGSMRNCKWNHFSFLNKNGPKRRHSRGH